MPAEFGQDYAWPDAAGTPTDPTVAFVESTVEMYIQHSTELLAEFIVAGAACTALIVRVDVGVAIGGATTWDEGFSGKAIVGCAVGTHRCMIRVPESCYVRIALMRVGGTANTLVHAIVATRRQPFLVGLSGQPPELAGVQQNGVILWDDGAGGAAATGGAYALGPAGTGHWIPTSCATEMVLYATLTGGPSTTIELQVE